MAQVKRLICDTGALEERGAGVRFEVRLRGETLPAFAVRFEGTVHAYVNRCAHIPVELDWVEGEFFDASGLYLICATHGATYLPESGRCILGPCKGAQLRKLPVLEEGGQVFILVGEESDGR
jgi:nitrite reductase/ring-hydroxylating ferredoxin subunit